MRSIRRQSGLSLFGFVFVVAVVLLAALVGFRVLPAYIEFFSVEKALQQSLADTRDLSGSGELRRNFQRKADAGYIESVQGRDIEVRKQGNDIIATVAWTRKLHLAGNASLLIEFEAKAVR